MYNEECASSVYYLSTRKHSNIIIILFARSETNVGKSTISVMILHRSTIDFDSIECDKIKRFILKHKQYFNSWLIDCPLKIFLPILLVQWLGNTLIACRWAEHIRLTLTIAYASWWYYGRRWCWYWWFDAFSGWWTLQIRWKLTIAWVSIGCVLPIDAIPLRWTLTIWCADMILTELIRWCTLTAVIADNSTGGHLKKKGERLERCYSFSTFIGV